MTDQNSIGENKRTKLTMVAKLILKNGDLFFRGTITDVKTGRTVAINKGKSIDEAVREIVAAGHTAQKRDTGP